MIGYRFKCDLFNDSDPKLAHQSGLTEVGKTCGFCGQLRPNQWTALLIGVVPKGLSHSIRSQTRMAPGSRLPQA
jgi:hypothetical protein